MVKNIWSFTLFVFIFLEPCFGIGASICLYLLNPLKLTCLGTKHRNCAWVFNEHCQLLLRASIPAKLNITQQHCRLMWSGILVEMKSGLPFHVLKVFRLCLWGGVITVVKFFLCECSSKVSKVTQKTDVREKLFIALWGFLFLFMLVKNILFCVCGFSTYTALWYFPHYILHYGSLVSDIFGAQCVGSISVFCTQ
jgi:hypothetical protein